MRKSYCSLYLIFLLSSCGGEGIYSSQGSSLAGDIKPAEGLISSSLVLENTSDFKESVACSAIGEAKILVVPCHFSGEREFKETDRELIRKSFFEDDLSSKGDGNYYSVREFYKKSSLGKLNISGEVTSILEVPYTVEQIENDGNYFPGVPAAEYLKAASDEILQEYDVNKDGYVDNVVFVYSTPTSERSGNFWAWVNTFATDSNLSRPSLAHHMWVGIDNFTDETYFSSDAHSVIHETGHLLGLRDYYPSDNYNLALGGHSMMDYNISDQDPYSKMLLGWNDPIYYDFNGYEEVTIDLPKFQGSNKTLLFKPNWNHTVMDEYLLFEYYTPDGLNELDAKNKYSNRPLGFTESGIKIYHVDSRIAKCVYIPEISKLRFDSYVSEIPEEYDSTVYYVIGASNSEEDSRTDASRQGRYKQVALVENKKYNQLQSGKTADNDSLFQEGDSFDSSSSAYLLNGKWNDKTEINLKMEVKELTSSYARITLTYKGETA